MPLTPPPKTGPAARLERLLNGAAHPADLAPDLEPEPTAPVIDLTAALGRSHQRLDGLRHLLEGTPDDTPPAA